MPVGNIDPQNDAFTRASMLLGSEEYPSTVQQAICKNEGYLMYRPLSIWSGYHREFNEDVSIDSFDMLSAAYLTAGKYDLYANMALGNAVGTVSLDGTVIISGTSQSGSLSEWTAATDGWYTVKSRISIDAESAGAMGWTLSTRQYEE